MRPRPEAKLRSEAAAHTAGPAAAALLRPAIAPGPWLGRAAAFRLEPVADPLFDRRLVVPGFTAGWIVLSYAGDPAAPPARPVVRVLRGAESAVQDFILPGAAPGRAHWLGLIPPDAREIHLAAGPGFALERVGLCSELGVLGQCLMRRPLRFLAALVERARGSERRYRDILRGACAVAPMSRFTAWAAARDRAIRAPASALGVHCLILARSGEDGALAETLDALARQTHAPRGIRVAWEGPPPTAPDGRAEHLTWDPNRSPGELVGDADALCLLRPGDALAPDALALMAQALPGADLAYGDALGPRGEPRLKPDWSPNLALTTGYVGRGALVSRRLLAALPREPLGRSGEADLALDVAVATSCTRAAHVPRVLIRTADHAHAARARARTIDACLAANGQPARAILRGDGPDPVVDLLWPLPEPAPLVSVVIPSRDRLDLIARACRGVLRETAYPAIELIVVDNGSTDPAVLAHYEALRRDPRVEILADPRPFNFAAMVNAGVEAAAGAVVVLLNNDVAVLEPGWLEAMVRQACRPEVGAVGAKLLYGDGRLQHAGVVVGLGGRAGHILRRRPGDTPGHLGRLRVAHEVSAVTAACLAVTREKYHAVGGLDAEAFPVDFNDVDFCLRLAARGWKTVWTPAATLAHLESVSRGPSVGPKRARFEAEAARFEARWRDTIRHDPFYHPALSLTTFGEDLE